MGKSKGLRRRPSTPNLKIAAPSNHTAGADPSPPETPTRSSPLSRKISLKPRRQPDFTDNFSSIEEDPAIQPMGVGYQFSYRPKVVAPEELSPRSASTSTSALIADEAGPDAASGRGVGFNPIMSEANEEREADADNESEADSSGDDFTSESESGYDGEAGSTKPRIRRRTIQLTATSTTTTFVCDFVIEDIDAMDSGCEGLDVLHPTEIESSRSHSRPRRGKHLDRNMMQEFKNLNCSADPSDDELEYDDHLAFIRQQQELRRLRRVSMSSSFGKRTYSELSDSDPDDLGIGDVNEVGSSARRMRKKLHRTSLLFQDPPPPRIDELEEPESENDCFGPPPYSLAMELPYWTMEIMEME